MSEAVREITREELIAEKAEPVSYTHLILEQCQIPRPTGGTVFTAEEAKEVAGRLGYPVLVRPSYVLGGQGMQIRCV